MENPNFQKSCDLNPMYKFVCRFVSSVAKMQIEDKNPKKAAVPQETNKLQQKSQETNLQSRNPKVALIPVCVPNTSSQCLFCKQEVHIRITVKTSK